MDIVIAGAGALGRVTCDFVSSCGHRVLAFIDDSGQFTGKTVNGFPVYLPERIDELLEQDPVFSIAILDGKGRESMGERILQRNGKFIELRMEGSFISPFATIGQGCSLFPHAYVMNNVVMGNYCHVHMFTVIGHDVAVGDYCAFTPQCVIGGGSQIGRGVSFGMGASVVPNTKIGDYCVIGAGAIVTRDVPAHSVVFGAPSKIMKRRA
ncbi:MAG: NeuD/PglB/VioB family sugar acetyltransferase [Syntrophobacteraceae bacterium]